jgi:hypothetical protein
LLETKIVPPCSSSLSRGRPHPRFLLLRSGQVAARTVKANWARSSRSWYLAPLRKPKHCYLTPQHYRASTKVMRGSHSTRPGLRAPVQSCLLPNYTRTDKVDPRIIVRLEGLCPVKSPATSTGIEPATFRLVAQCFNYATACPQQNK